jgi:hypothetical protein
MVNPQLPFGPNARLSTESIVVYPMASRRW